MNNPNHTTETRGADSGAAPGSAAPFADRQRVSLAEWDALSPPWDRMGDCIVINQENGPDHCESGWMITVMAKDGTTKRLDSHWMKPNDPDQRPATE